MKKSPRENERFYPSQAKVMIQTIIENHLKDAEYDHAAAKGLAEKIADEIKTACKGLSIPSYKIVV